MPTFDQNNLSEIEVCLNTFDTFCDFKLAVALIILINLLMEIEEKGGMLLNQHVY